MSDQRQWTAEKVRALGLTTDLVTAYKIVFGGGKNQAWAAFHAGNLPFPALKCGRRVRVPVASLLELLGIQDKAA